MDSRIFLIYGSDARQLTLSLLEHSDIKSRVPFGTSIALKPNLVVASPADLGATTHPGVLEGIIEYFFENGHRNISVIESSWVGERTARAFEVCGYGEVLKRFNVPFVDLKKDKAISVKSQIGRIDICETALKTDYLINLPVLKGHCQTRLTCALKNLKGCIPDHEKRRFHTMGLHKPIAGLAAVLKPKLTIVDGLCGDLNFEEGGTPVLSNRMLLGEDMVALDTFACALMGINLDDVPYIALAELYGAGSANVENENIIALNSPKKSAPIKQSGITKNLTRYVKEDSACSACYAGLVHALYRLKEERGTPCKLPVAIGQGYKGVAFDGVGVGNCCNCASAQIKGCPPNAGAIVQALIDFEKTQ